LVIQAQQEGRQYGLILPGIRIEQDVGSAHQAYCLTRLASFHQPDLNSELQVGE
jgi:hypothetical protein